MLEFINQELEYLKINGLHRSLRTIEKVDGPRIRIDGKEYINFCSNNYLGLAGHPEVVKRAIAAIKDFGFGSGASRLISGNTAVHEALEKKIAQFKGREAALIFPTGYMANLGVISSLLDEKDTVIVDRLSHASIIDACRLSKAKMQVCPHRNLHDLEKILKRSAKFGKRLFVTDAVFSMDGTLAHLPEIIKLAKNYDTIVMIDEAHATGILGNKGQGLEEYYNVEGQVDILLGTMSKTLGSIGGYVAGSHGLIDYLRNKARSFVYTTALPAAACAAALAALETIEQQPDLRKKLWENTKALKALIKELGVKTVETESPIIPIIIGNLDRTMKLSAQLFERGIFVSGIRPPTVPKGECRLRITVMATHSKEDIECLASSLRALIPA